MTGISKWRLPGWLKRPAGSEGVVVSTRIRLARNFRDLRFIGQAGPSERQESLNRVEQFSLAHPELKLAFSTLRELEPLSRGLLAERGLINQELASEPASAALASIPGQAASILVNEEDHLRLQVMQPGLALDAGLKKACQLDEHLINAFALAVHPRFGFLTACPTNVGTGLRASVMLHLPALALTRGIVQVLQAVLHMGLAVRGFYGEGTEFRSVFFQISNHVTLGRNESEVAAHLQGVVSQIVDRELEARQKLLKENALLLEDKIGRALGVLSAARLLGFEEALELLSTVWLGVETGLAPLCGENILTELLLLIQPAHLQSMAGRTLSAEDQLAQRAKWVRKRLRLSPGQMGD